MTIGRRSLLVVVLCLFFFDVFTVNGFGIRSIQGPSDLVVNDIGLHKRNPSDAKSIEQYAGDTDEEREAERSRSQKCMKKEDEAACCKDFDCEYKRMNAEVGRCQTVAQFRANEHKETDGCNRLQNTMVKYAEYSMKKRKNEDNPWYYGNLQQTTCVSPFSNTDEVAQIKYDAMRYLHSFDELLGNFAKYMREHGKKSESKYKVKFHPAPVKGIARMTDKNYGKYSPPTKHSCREITDACRGSLYFSNIEGVVAFMEVLEKKVKESPIIYYKEDCEEHDPMFCLPCDIIKIEFTNVKNRMTRDKNKDLAPYDTLYRDILVNIKMYVVFERGVRSTHLTHLTHPTHPTHFDHIP